MLERQFIHLSCLSSTQDVSSFNKDYLMNKFALAVIALPILIACSDKDVTLDSGTPPPLVNTPPVASFLTSTSNSIIGKDIYVDASVSTDADGDQLNYAWLLSSKPSNSNADFTDSDAKVTSVTFDVAGDYTFQLVVSDGTASSIMSKTIAVGGNALPPSHLTHQVVADAGSNQKVSISQTVVLDAHASFDKDGKALTYSWALISKPTGSSALLSASDSIFPSFIADVSGVYEASLSVTNSDGVASPVDSVMVAVGSATNTHPVADAGSDQSSLLLTAGNSITLNGIGSHDLDGDALSYSWTLHSKPVGSQATLEQVFLAQPVLYTDIAGDYNVVLIVGDGQSYSQPDSVNIHQAAAPASVNHTPIANAGPDQKGLVANQSVTLDGSASQDPDGDVITYAWTMISKPAVSSSSLVNSTSQNPSFTPDSDGDYVVQLTVNDGVINSSPDGVILSVGANNPNNNHIPAVTLTNNAALDSTVGDTITFTATVSDVDINDTHSYQWSFVSKPAGSSVNIASSSNMLTLTPDLLGSYSVQVIVTDNNAGVSKPNASAISINHLAQVLPLPPMHTLGLNSSIGGIEQAGALYSIDELAVVNGDDILVDSNGLDNAAALFQFKGYTALSKNHKQGFVYNPKSKKFYAQLEITGVYFGASVISFDPITDKIDVVAHIKSEFVNDNYVYNFDERMSVHPSGKYIIGNSRFGGKYNAGRFYIVNVEMELNSNGDLVKSAGYGQLNWIYDLGCGNASASSINEDGSVCTPTELYGKEPFTSNIWNGDNTLQFFAANNFRASDSRAPTQPSTSGLSELVPTDVNDLTKPWKRQNPNVNFGLDYDVRTYSKNGDVYISTQFLNNGTLFSENGGGGYVKFDCFNVIGALYDDTNRKTVAFCAGSSVQHGGLFTGTSTGTIGQTRSYGGWGNTIGQDIALTNTLGLLVTGRDKAASTFVDIKKYNPGVNYPYDASVLHALNINSGTDTALITGSKSANSVIGSAFIGAAETDNSEKYVVILSYDGGSRDHGAVLKYDRDTGSVTSIPFGFESMAYNYGKPLLANNKVYTAAMSASDYSSNRGTHIEYDATAGTVKELSGTANIQPGISLVAVATEIFGLGVDISASNKPTTLYKLDTNTGTVKALFSTANGLSNVTSQVLNADPVNTSLLVFAGDDPISSNVYCYDTALPTSSTNPTFSSLGFGTQHGIRAGSSAINQPHDIYRGLTYSAAASKWFFVARQNGGSVSNQVLLDPTIQSFDDCSTKTIKHEIDISAQPSTLLYEVSAGNTNPLFSGQPLFFGMGDKLGKLSVDANDGSITVVDISLTSLPISSDYTVTIQGYLSELSSGQITGVLEAENTITHDVQHYIFTYNGTNFTYSKLPSNIPLDVHYPGIVELK